VPTIGDLDGIRQRTRRCFAVSAAPVARDDPNVAMGLQPCGERANFAVREKRGKRCFDPTFH